MQQETDTISYAYVFLFGLERGKKYTYAWLYKIVLRTCTCCLHKLLGRVTAEPLLVGLEKRSQGPHVVHPVAGEARVVLASHEGRYRRREL
jgi:hypothetical protein